MELINYFKDFKEKIGFIELKDSYEGDLNKDIFYPIITDDLLEGINSGDFKNELDLYKIIDGTILILNLDEGFKYNKEYEKFLKNSVEFLKNIFLIKLLNFLKITTI